MSKLLTTNQVRWPKALVTAIVSPRLLQYAFCGMLGMLGGAAGVALSIGLVILVKLQIHPSVTLELRVIPLMILASSVGLGVSWLLNRTAQRLLPGLLRHVAQPGLQVTLVSSTFVSLLQTLLFFAR